MKKIHACSVLVTLLISIVTPVTLIVRLRLSKFQLKCATAVQEVVDTTGCRSYGGNQAMDWYWIFNPYLGQCQLIEECETIFRYDGFYKYDDCVRFCIHKADMATVEFLSASRKCNLGSSLVTIPVKEPVKSFGSKKVWLHFGTPNNVKCRLIDLNGDGEHYLPLGFPNQRLCQMACN